MSLTSPDAKAVVRAIDALTTQVQRLADAQPPTEGAPPVRDDSAPNLLRALVDRAARGVASEAEHEALRRRTEQMIAGRATWKAKAEEIEQDRNDWRSRAEEAEDEAERHKQDYLNACKTIADMHAAAVGRGDQGPTLGVVEDVADVRARGLAAEEGLANALATIERVRAARDRMANAKATDVDAIWCLDLVDAALNITEQHTTEA